MPGLGCPVYGQYISTRKESAESVKSGGEHRVTSSVKGTKEAAGAMPAIESGGQSCLYIRLSLSDKVSTGGSRVWFSLSTRESSLKSALNQMTSLRMPVCVKGYRSLPTSPCAMDPRNFLMADDAFETCHINFEGREYFPPMVPFGDGLRSRSPFSQSYEQVTYMIATQLSLEEVVRRFVGSVVSLDF